MSSLKPLASIIVPVYGTEKTLDSCVESLVKQTLRNVEIILVDDGSPDSCPEKCDQWALRDTRIKVLHKKNGGLSDARNAGLSIARAPYIGFVDSDDTIEEDMFEILYENITKYKADLSLCGVVHHFPTRNIESSAEQFEVVSGEDALNLTLQGKIPGIWAVVRLYSADLIRDVCFPKGVNYEDAYIAADIYKLASKVVIDPRPLYHYWHREGSITKTSVTNKSLDEISSFDHTCDIAELAYPHLSEACQFRRLWSRFDVLDKLAFSQRPLSNESQIIEDYLIRFLRSHAKEILKNENFRLSRKLSMCLLLINKKIYYAGARAMTRLRER